MELRGKTALVTGGAVRIGRALAMTLAEEGVRVALHYGASQEAAQETAADIRSQGGEVILIQEDLRRTERLETVITRAAEISGSLDILVNSAGVFDSAELEMTTVENWDDIFSINLKAPFFLSRAFARTLPAGRSGAIVNVADWRALRPDGKHAAYSAGKAGLVNLTQSLALALAPAVQVNAIAPGAILPPPGEGAAYMENLARRIPLRRTGSLEEIGRALVFLLRSDFITGETIVLSGGEHLL